MPRVSKALERRENPAYRLSPDVYHDGRGLDSRNRRWRFNAAEELQFLEVSSSASTIAKAIEMGTTDRQIADMSDRQIVKEHRRHPQRSAGAEDAIRP